MKDLTPQEKTTLIGKIKSFCDITWSDTDTENDVWDMIVSSINRIDEIAGVELDYLISPESETSDNLYNTMSYLGQELLKNRVFYLREKALDDFEKNYQGKITSLFLKGKVAKRNVIQQENI